MDAKYDRDGYGSGEKVHVRILGVGDTLRWSWDVLTDRLELAGLTFVVALISVVSTTGISRPAPGAQPEFAPWVWPTYLVFFLALAVAWGVVYETTNDAVANRSRPLGDRVTTAATRLPSLIVTTVLMFFISFVGLIFLVLPGIYLFHRLLLSYPACVIDGKGPIASLKAGWSASSGSLLKVFIVDLSYVVLTGLWGGVANLFGQYTLAGGLVSAVGTAILLPLFGLAFGHLYLESSRNT